jgi:hypothetical protein
LVPVTGADRTPSFQPMLMLQGLLINLGIGLLGLGLVCQGVSNKFNE